MGSLDAQQRDVPLASALATACAGGRSGWLEVYGPDGPAGTVIVSRGQVAWAAGRGQPEHLGRFLERLGYLTPAQLRDISEEFTRLGGARKLGRLLEEAGLVARPVLRLCLLLHVRMALATLLGRGDLLASWEEGTFCAEDELTFPLGQVVPLWARPLDTTSHSSAPEYAATALLPLGDLQGYRGSVVVDWTGRTVARHGFAAAERDEASIVAAAAVGLLGGPLGLGASEQGFLEGEQGSVVARWIDSPHRLIAAVSLDRSGKPGTVLHRLASGATALAAALAGSPVDPGPQGAS